MYLLNKRLPGSYRAVFFLLLVASLLSGCAAQRAYDEGQSLVSRGRIKEGVSRLEEATRLRPENAAYKIALLTARSSEVNRILLRAESLRRDGALSEAEKEYGEVLKLEWQNVLARQGLEAIAMERRHRVAVRHAEDMLSASGDAALNEVVRKVEDVLAENPGQRDALNLKARIADRSKVKNESTPELAEGFKKSVSLAFRDAPLRSIFDVISEVSGLNFILDKDIRPDLKATVQGKNSTVEEMVKVLLLTNQLDYRVLNKNSILVYPANPQKQKDYRPLSIRTFYLANADVKTVAGTLKAILKTADMVVDERLSLIILRDTPEALVVAERLVALQDIADPEVMLEVEILEVKRSKLLELGVKWPEQLTFTPIPSSGTKLTVDDVKNLRSSTIQADIGSASVNIGKEDQDSNILANPRIRVRNKEKAKIMIGDKVPVITATSTSTGFVSETLSYVDVGLRLEVEPNIYLDEEVAIKISLEVSNLVREVKSNSGTLAYQIGTRNANTVLRLKDGETQILAGLISNEDRASSSKLPGLGELPVLGRLFGSQKDDQQRSEIVLSITPRLIRAIRRPDIDAASFAAGTESQVGVEPVQFTQPVSTDKANVNAKEGLELPAVARTAAPVVPLAPASGVADVKASEDSAVVSRVPAVPVAGATLSWQGPESAKLGEPVLMSLKLASEAAVQSMPLLVQYDPAYWQIDTVTEGGFFNQLGVATSFSHRSDPSQGKIFAAIVRSDAGINGSGSLVDIRLRPIKQGKTSLKVLSATPSPASSRMMDLPEIVVEIRP